MSAASSGAGGGRGAGSKRGRAKDPEDGAKPAGKKRSAASARAKGGGGEATGGGSGPQWWLVKSEPDEYSIDSLRDAPGGRGFWDGVRSFQARNLMQQMRVGDLAFFYHSSCKVPAIVGVCRVVEEAKPDPTALDPRHKYFDEKSDPGNPRWYGVTFEYVRTLKRQLTLTELKRHKEGALSELALLRVPRLSVQRVSEGCWRFLEGLEGEEEQEA